MSNQHDWSDDSQFDRLVDGELTGDEYEMFLRSLDDRPDGWRRCAVAFLESQALGQEFRTLRGELEEVPSFVERARPSRPASGIGRLVVAAAASFVVAFGLGVWWRSDLRPLPEAGPALVSDETPWSGVGTEMAPDRAVKPAMARTGPEAPPDRMTLVVDRGDGQSDGFNMPIYSEDDAYAWWMMEQSSLPVQIERDLRQAGYQIETRREWTPVELQDGRRVVFPIDELQVRPVSNTY